MIVLLLVSRLYVSHNQFLVYDASVPEPGLDWTDTHARQGFARRLSTVSFDTLLPYGTAALAVCLGPYPAERRSDRAIAVPFYSPTGNVEIAGPEEVGIDRHVLLTPGHYRLVAAQSITHESPEQNDEYQLEIDLFFQQTEAPVQSSEILVADPSLSPPSVLLEDAEIA